MKNIAICLLLALSFPAFTQTPPIPSGSTVYIDPMDGYETYLSAAILKKHVPIVVVTDKSKAEYVIQSTVIHKSMANAAPVVAINNTVNNGTQTQTPGNEVQEAMRRGSEERAAEKHALGETNASITVVDTHSSQVVFAHAAEKMGTAQVQNTAEDCAKHLKEFIEKSEKPKR